jgi:ubiquinone/menaquinone biosynthesis C-methylase UbiE
MNRYAGKIPLLVDVVVELVGQAEGTVLEIGVGSGGLLPLYDAGKVKKVYGLDPHEGLIDTARQAAGSLDVEVEFLVEGAEAISLADNSVDTVVSTFTLCTIPDLPRALGEMSRVLKPAGKILFFEHGLSPDPSVQRWQRLEERFHRWVFQGCYLTREIPQTIENAGFKISGMEIEYLPRLPKSWAYTWRGSAAMHSDA